jgi:hypothetical protein
MTLRSSSIAARIAIAIAVFAMRQSTAHAQESASGATTMEKFGAARVNPRQRQVLTFTLTADAAMDTEKGAGEIASLGPHADLRGGLRYRRQHRSAGLSINATSGLQHYPRLSRVRAVTHSLDAGFSTSLGRHTKIQITQRAVQSPYFTMSLPTDLVGADATDAAPLLTGYDLFRWNNLSLSTGVAVNQAVGRRSSVTIEYGSQRTRMEGGRFASHTARVGYNHQISRYATARLGYARELMARQTGAADLDLRARRSHDIDLGVDYNRPLSLSRRTKLAFRSGSSLVPSNGRTHVQLSGAASLSREIGRTWTTSLDYSRQVQFVETMAEPLLSDAVSLRVQGLPLRRLHVSVSASTSMGQVGFGAGDREYDTHHAAVRARWTFHRFLAVYADSSYYSHRFGAAVAFAPGVQRYADRREVRFGLTTWVPLLH